MRKAITYILIMSFLFSSVFSFVTLVQKVDAAGGTIYEAETAVGVDTEVLTSSGTSYINLKDKANNSSITWQNVNVPNDGNYILTFNYSNSTPIDKPISLTVNGQKLTTFNCVSTGSTSTPTWATLTNIVVLNSGNNTVKLASESNAGPDVDFFELVPYGTIIQAEASTKHVQPSTNNNQPGFTGTGFTQISTGKTPPAYLLWDNIVIPAAGKYTIKIRYANGSSARPAAVYVNGTKIVNTVGAATGAWSNWVYENLPNIDFNAGVNSIMIEPLLDSAGKTNATPLYDKLEICPVAVPILGDQTFRTTNFETTDVNPIIAATATDSILNSPLLDGKLINSLSDTSVKIIDKSSNRMAEVTIPATKMGVISFPFNKSLTIPAPMNSYTFESSFMLSDKNANYLFKLMNVSGSPESVMFLFGMDGNIYARSNNTAGGALAQRASWTKDTLYKIKLVFHMDTKSYDMYLDGNKIVNSEPMQADTSLLGLKGFNMQVKDGARLETKILIDDIQLSGSNAAGTAPIVNTNPGKLYEDQPYIGTPVNYYVSPTGLDTVNNGKTVDTPFKTIQKAAALTNPGDTVYIMPGTYLANTPEANKWLNITRSGARDYETGQTYYITYKAFDPANKPKLLLADKMRGIWTILAVQANYIIVDGLEVEGNNQNLTLAMGEENYNSAAAGGSDWSKYALTNTNGMSFSGHHITFKNCNVHDVAGGGLGGGGDYITIENNNVYNNSWYCFYANSGISFLNDVDYDKNTTDYKIIVRNNVVHDNETKVKWITTKAYSDGNGIIFDVDTNYHGKKLVVNNLVYNNGGGGLHAYRSSNIDFINNTAYKNGASPNLNYPNMDTISADNCRFINNISVARNGKPNTSNNGENNIFANNIYFGGNISKTGQYTNLLLDPKFVALNDSEKQYDFHLLPDSPAIDYGIRTYAPSIDFAGDSRPQGADRYDIGAYESPFTGATRLENDELIILPPPPIVNENAKAVYGTPVVDGEIDAIWNTASVFETTKIGDYTVASATAKVRALWDEANIYILAEVKDAILSDKSKDLWQHDAVEFFVDENNGKSATYQLDDANYRVNYKGIKSVSSSGKKPTVDSFTGTSKIVQGGYVVEVALPLTLSPGVVNRIIGFDVLVIDDTDGNGTRDNTAQWSNEKANWWFNTTGWGNLTMVAAAVPVTAVTLDKSSVTLEKGETLVLNAAVLPESATNKGILWASDKPEIASVNSVTGAVYAIDSGKAAITAITVDGGKTASCSVVVIDKENLRAAFQTALAAYNAAESGDKDGQYPQSAMDAFNSAIYGAKAVIDNVNCTQEEIDLSEVAIASAVEVFNSAKIIVDKSELDGAILTAELIYQKAIEEIKGNKYKDEIKELAAAIDSAKAVFNEVKVTQAQVDAATLLLNASTEKLAKHVTVLDKKDLIKVIKKASYIVKKAEEGTKDGQYTPGSKAIFEAAIKEARIVAGNKNATFVQVNKAEADLNTATAVFLKGKVIVNRSELKAVISQADAVYRTIKEGIKNGQYSQKAVLSFRKQIIAAKILLVKKEVTQFQIDSAAQKLRETAESFKLPQP